MRRWNRWPVLLALWMLSPQWALAAPKRANCGRPNMMLVVDISGSMTQERKLQSLQAAVSDIVTRYAQTYRFGLIAFKGTKADLLVPLGPEDVAASSSHANGIVEAVKKFVAVGGTPMLGAMTLARKNYESILPKDRLHKQADLAVKRVNFVLLITDGEPTDGDPTPEIKRLFSLQVGPKTYAIRTFVVGLGTLPNIRPDLLRKYAAAGGGPDQFLQATTVSSLASKIEQAVKDALPKEECNGVDDDCDGSIDENLLRDCDTACGKGRQTCKDAKWTRCDAPSSGPETCDNADNDCDGVVDNGLDRDCATACGKGRQSCVRGRWGNCSAKKPGKEICDGLDNDCDGQVDEGQELCPNGQCLSMQGTKRCKIDCSSNECPSGFRCDAATKECFLKPCEKNNPCKPGEVCEDASGKIVCRNLCKDVLCPAGKTCGLAGTCINCYENDCPPKTLCREGRCVPDLCHDKVCAQDQLCREGVCVAACKGVQCAKGELCQTMDPKQQQGVCIQDRCLGTNCKAQEICVNGQCVENRCTQKGTSQCIAQKMCDPLTGACVDNPCQWTQCPTNLSCYRGECLEKLPSPDGRDYGLCWKKGDCKSEGAICRNNLCIPGDSTPPKQEGCNCSVVRGGSPMASWFALGVLLLFVGRLRRAKRKKRGSYGRDCN